MLDDDRRVYDRIIFKASQPLQPEQRILSRLRHVIFHRVNCSIANKIGLMSLLIGIVLLLSLCWSEFCAVAAPEFGLTLSLKVALLALLPPAFAAVQMFVGKRRHSQENPSQWFPRFRLMVIAHTILWTVTSVTIVAWLQWSAIIELIPMCKSIPLADDLILIAPAMLGLIGSWAIFIFGAPEGSLAKSKTRASVFGLWMRMQVIMIAAPILFAFFITDCLSLARAVEFSPTTQLAFWALFTLTVIAAVLLYPRLMLVVWSTKRVDDKPLQERCQKLFQIAGIRPRQIRVWKTGNAVVNAAAVGIVPGTEVVVISDMLLDKFDDNEVDAIVLHEIGHIKHCHCIKRIAMILIPLTILAIDQAAGLGMHRLITESSLLSSIFGSMTQFLPAVAFMAYLVVISRTLFRSMEFEADRFAIETLQGTHDHCPVESALEKMAVIYPRQVDRRSGLHPSIRQRLAFAIELNAETIEKQGTMDTSVPTPKGISLDPVAAK